MIRHLFSLICPIGFLRLYFGGGGGSSRQSNDTNIQDKRVVVDSGAGISGDNSSITVNAADVDVVKRAMDSFDKGSVTLGQGYSSLLEAAGKIFDTSTKAVTGAQAGLASAYAQHEQDSKGAVDQKTILALAGLAAVVVGAALFRGKA